MKFKQILQPISRVASAFIKEQKGVVKTVPSGHFERPEISFSTLLEIHDKDESVGLAVQFMAEAVVGPGHYTTASDSEAKKIVDDFAEDVNLDAILFQGVEELVGYGNSFWEKIDERFLSRLQILPIDSRWEVEREDTDKANLIRQSKGLKTVDFTPKQIIHWRWNVRNSRPFGRGIIHYMAESKQYTLRFEDNTSKTYTIPNLASQKWMIENDERLVFHHLIPKSVWTFEGASEEYVTSQAGTLRKLEAGERIVTNSPVKIVSESIDPRGRFDAFLQDLDVKIIRATQSPILKLFTTPGFTEASSRVVEDQFNRKVLALQRYVKRIVEREIYHPILIQNGVDPEKAEVRLHWGSGERPSIDVKDIIEAVKMGIVEKDEAREMLVEYGWKLAGGAPTSVASSEGE